MEVNAVFENHEKSLDYVLVLKSMKEIPFSVGKKLLIDFLQGNKSNESITRNRLDLKQNFGCLAYNKYEIEKLIDNLAMNDLIKLKNHPH